MTDFLEEEPRWSGPPVTGPIEPASGQDLRDLGIGIFDKLDRAAIGIAHRGETQIAVYDTAKCIEILAEEMEPEDADAWFWFNVEGAYFGDDTPLFITTEET